jgi:hypothetical protein
VRTTGTAGARRPPSHAADSQIRRRPSSGPSAGRAGDPWAPKHRGRGVSKAKNERAHVLMTLLGQHTLKTRTDLRAIRTASASSVVKSRAHAELSAFRGGSPRAVVQLSPALRSRDRPRTASGVRASVGVVHDGASATLDPPGQPSKAAATKGKARCGRQPGSDSWVRSVV